MTTPNTPDIPQDPSPKRTASIAFFVVALGVWAFGWFSLGQHVVTLLHPKPQSDVLPPSTDFQPTPQAIQPPKPPAPDPVVSYAPQRWDEVDPSLSVIQPPETVRQLIYRRKCSTGPSTPLNVQIASEINCAQPNLFTSIADIPNIDLQPGANPFLQNDAARSLRKVAATYPHETLSINSSWRSVVQQHILKSWQGSCGVSIAATPGSSRHESGLAIDLPLTSIYPFHDTLKEHSWRWYCDATNRGLLRRCRDVPHYTYHSGKKLNRFAIAAFQRLWNRANPNDTIPVNGAFTNATARRLNHSPLNGFDTGTTCGETLQSERCPSSFRDVSIRYAWWSEIEAVTQAQWLLPCRTSDAGNLFCPSAGVTRAGFADALHRALDLSSPPEGEAIPFEDVPTSHPNYEAIQAVAYAGISLGCTSDSKQFCPDAPPTWAQATAWVSRAQGARLAAPKGVFNDVEKDHWAASHIEHAYKQGWMRGCSKKGRFCPSWRLSRARLAELLVRTFSPPIEVECRTSAPKPDGDHTFSSPVRTHSEPRPNPKPDGVH